MTEPNCAQCRGGCCDHNIKLFGLTRNDLLSLAKYNLVRYYTTASFPDLRSMYHHLISSHAENGIYALKLEWGDVDAIRIGACNCLVDGLCIIHDALPGPCRRMEVGGSSCTSIFNNRKP
jgi:hypothetical protein